MFNRISSQASKLIKMTSQKYKKNEKTKTKLITVTSGKGGVGKTTLGANLAYLMAKSGLKVAIVDADIGLANMQVIFNMKPEVTLFDYIKGRVNLKEVILKTPYDNLYLVAGKSGYEYTKNTNSFVLSRIVNDIVGLDLFDVVFVDTGAGLNDYVKEFLMISDNILAVTTTDPSALTDVYSLISMLSNSKEKLMLCFNHTKSYGLGDSITKSLIKLNKANRLNTNFMVQYIGNVATTANITTTGRLRKLFSREFPDDEITRQMKVIKEFLVENIK